MSDKGFTLVELLAVIAILAIISIIAVPQAFNFSRKIKKDLYCDKVEMILNEVRRYGNEHPSMLKENCYITKPVSDFIELGLLKAETDEAGKLITNPYNEQGMDNVRVAIAIKNKNAIAYLMETDGELKDFCEENVSLNLPAC